MNAAAVEVMKDLTDLVIAYGVSDEYRYGRTGILRLDLRCWIYPLLISCQLCIPSDVSIIREEMRVRLSYFLFSNCSMDSNQYPRKLVTTIVSTFTAHYIFKWPTFFPDTPLEPSSLPSFDGRAVLYPTTANLRDYMSWRQVDCTSDAYRMSSC